MQAKRLSYSCSGLVALLTCLTATLVAQDKDIIESDPAAAAAREATFLTGTRQLTFDGKRSGEGYFSADGSQIVFQSEREAGNPFYQIYVMDLENGDIERVSPGFGKTTCAWIHPDGKQVLFASTQDDKQAKKKQADEIAMRESGKERRYAWDYDATYELYRYDRPTKKYTRLTDVPGYDAEASWSPDGKLIAFTSNREAYQRKLTPEEQKNFDIDPAYMNDIYIMHADGSHVTRLTKAPGYDGGPFFSPDGKRICWRRFTPNGAIAEVWTMNIDGSDKRQITRFGAMSWAPYYHPSGEYLIFTTNKHGFANFELYLVDTQGRSAPVRVTHTKGFDGLPVFTPDGKQLAWTSNRTAAKQSQIFIADWDHEAARKLLGIDSQSPSIALNPQDSASVREQAAASKKAASAQFLPQDVMRHVAYLCRDELAGRLTGTRGEQLATAYVAAYMDSLGLEPAGDDGGWFQEFTFTSGVDLGKANHLAAGNRKYQVNEDWRPVSFSKNGKLAPSEVVFGGYGIVVPASGDQPEYDSYVHLDVKDKWVVVFRFMPEDISAKRRQHLSRPSQLRFKTMLARDRGARGLIVVSGPRSKAKRQLIPLQSDGALSGASIPVVSVTDAVVDAWLATNKKSLADLQAKLDTGEMAMGFPIKGVKLTAAIDVQQIKKTGRNVIGRLPANEKHPAAQAVIVGAHVDHLGRGASGSSLARDDERSAIHYGADDNASGVAAMLEVAEYLADLKRQGKLQQKRDLLFAAWSGEELGLIGSNHFVKTFGMPAHGHGHGHGHAAGVGAKPKPLPPAKPPSPAKPTASASPHKLPPNSKKPAAHDPHGHGAHAHQHGIYPAIAACINMDMVGRLDKNLVLQGIGSSSIWKSEIERRNAPVGLAITLQDDSYLPTDASSFYMQGVPILSAFTGSHADYHTPRDTPDTLNYEGTAKVAKLMGLITRSLTLRDDAPDYIAQKAPENKGTKARLRAYLGTIPDYAEDVKGVKLGGAAKGGPADKAGARAGDIIVELAGKKIENIYDYTYAIEALKIGKKVKMVVERKGKRITLELVPGSRD